MDSYEREERPKGMKSGPLTNHVGYLGKREIGGLLKEWGKLFLKLQSSFLSLVSFGCTLEVPMSIED